MNRADIEKAACEFINAVNFLNKEEHHPFWRIMRVMEYYSFIAGAEYMKEQIINKAKDLSIFENEMRSFIKKIESEISGFAIKQIQKWKKQE